MKSHAHPVLFFALVSVLALGACGRSAEPTKVIVATDATYPPFESVDEGTNEIVGFDVDLIKAIGAKENLDIQLEIVTWDLLLEGMAQCKYQAAISAMTINEERKKDFNFTDPYFAAGQVVTVRSDDTDITGKDALSGKTIGVQAGTTGDLEAQKIEGAKVEAYEQIGPAFDDLLNGQIDAIIADNLTALDYVGTNAGKLRIAGDVFTDEFYGIAVCKTNTELLTRLNSGLAKVKAEGLIDQLFKKWIEGKE